MTALDDLVRKISDARVRADNLDLDQARWRCLLRAASPVNVARRLIDGWQVGRDAGVRQRLALAWLFLRVDATPWAGYPPSEVSDA